MSKTMTHMPEVTKLFFYTMAFRWCPCITLLFPNKSNEFLTVKAERRRRRFVISKEVPEIYPLFL